MFYCPRIAQPLKVRYVQQQQYCRLYFPDFAKITLPQLAQKTAKPCTAEEFHAVEPSMGMRRTPLVNPPQLQSLASELYPKPISEKCYAADQVGEQILQRVPPPFCRFEPRPCLNPNAAAYCTLRLVSNAPSLQSA